MADQNYMLDSANMSGVDLSIAVAGIKLANPVIAASGTFGYGEEFERFADLRRIGGICVKGTSARPIDGNLPPRPGTRACCKFPQCPKMKPKKYS